MHADRDLRVPPAAEVALFRVAQEALLNAHKHARASRVDVRVEQRRTEVVLEVTDDGIGLSADAWTSARGTGLRSMRDRAEELGGTWNIESSPSNGTRVCARLPMASGFQ